ncbi:1-aminocyclopropane-1-carboxylate oxidase [Cucumis melo var. makuwa]|uniref:1-aminocyclopropane-1-carboxylate oxidase n=1 Tax=Cucumis melo var. makuwa TaxID=1194695 RepID=A0A5D3C991_CUCMM|nr:1-aminocyclopropane-1-carboxylate oxidase [Cucumis melo var. makuwa]
MVMMSPERAAATPFEFRAPPPSPIGTSRRSSVTNDEVLTEFLEHSLRVPDLVLPETIFPRERFVENPPRIDFRLIESYDRDSVLKILDSMRSFGFFQLVNHGIPVELIGAVAAAADAGVFGISPEKKVAVGRSPEKAYGFEELWHGEDESEVSEEFVWNRDEDLKMEMEAISPIGYSNFSKKMEWLTQLTEKLGEKMLEIFLENSGKIARNEVFSGHGPVWCVYKQKIKQRLSVWNDELENCFKHDVIRMLIRGTDFSHAFCFHFCHGSSPLFHAYSKRGWVSFVADESAVVVTVGDHIQVRHTSTLI